MKTVTGMGGMGNARELAEMLRQLGRGRDTVLAHITPEEAQMLLDRGGSGTTNPQTGLPEFQEDYADPQYDFYGKAPAEDQTYDPFAGMPAETPTGPMFEPSANLGDMVDQQQAADFYGAPPMDYGDITAPQPRQDISAYFGAPAAEQPGFLERGAQTIEQGATTAKELAGKYPNVARLLSTGVTSLPALLNAARMRRESQRSAQELRALGAPLRAQGQALQTQALAGQLTPQQAAQQEASRARLRQGAASRGTTAGTQAAMIENQLARTRSQLSESNLNNAIKMLNLANAYDEAAIRAKLAGDRDVSDTLGRIYSYIGQQLGGTANAAVPPAATTRATDQILEQPPVTQRPGQRNE